MHFRHSPVSLHHKHTNQPTYAAYLETLAAFKIALFRETREIRHNGHAMLKITANDMQQLVKLTLAYYSYANQWRIEVADVTGPPLKSSEKK